MVKKFFSAFLALCLALSMMACCGVAESAIDLWDLTITFANGKTYTLPMSLKDAEAAGLNVPAEAYDLEEGYYYMAVGVNDGRNAFDVRVVHDKDGEDIPWMTGFSVDSDDNAGANVCGMVLGETTAADVVAALGADYEGDTQGNSLTYYLCDVHVVCNLDFESDAADAKLTDVSVHHTFTEDFGTGFSDKAGVQDADLPDAATMPYNQVIVDGKLYTSGDTVQKFLDNGWLMQAGGYAADDEIEARDNGWVEGGFVNMYNGSSMIRVYAYNMSDSVSRWADCTVRAVETRADFGENCIVTPSNLNIGSSYDEIVAEFGEPIYTYEDSKGDTEAHFEVLDQYEWTFDFDKDTNIAYTVKVEF